MNKFRKLTQHPPLLIAIIIAIIVFFLLTFAAGKRHFRDEPIYDFSLPDPIVSDPVTPATNSTTDQP